MSWPRPTDMRVSRLYLPTSIQAGQDIELDDDSAHYVRNVLRLKQSAPLIVFNGEGGEWTAKIQESHRKRVAIRTERWIDRHVESPLTVHLGLGVSRSERMDWAIQKAVELGVSTIFPLLTERCVVQLKEEKRRQKHRHWQRIVQNAAEQCGRTRLPEVTDIHTLGDWLTVPQGLKIFLDPNARATLSQLQPDAHQVALLSGPEGGFSETERQLAEAAGFIPVRLGKRILRTETAALAALSALQLLWGDFGESA